METNVYLIVITHNSRQQIGYLLAQLGPYLASALRLVVVDNGSTDGTCDAIRNQLPNTIIIENRAHLGKVKAANIGIAFAIQNRASHVLFLPVDAQLSQDYFSNLIHKKADLAAPIIGYGLGNNLMTYVVGGTLSQVMHVPQLTRLAQRPPLSFNTTPAFISLEFFCAKAQVFEKIGLFDDGYSDSYADVDFCLRVKKAGLKIAIEPKALVTVNREQVGAATTKRLHKSLTRDLGRFRAKHMNVWRRTLHVASMAFSQSKAFIGTKSVNVPQYPL